jgi:hypothetical protein
MLLVVALGFAFLATPVSATVIFRDDFESDEAVDSNGTTESDANPEIGEGDIGGSWDLLEPDGPYDLQVKTDPPDRDNNYLVVSRPGSNWLQTQARATGWDAGALANETVVVKATIATPLQQGMVFINGWTNVSWQGRAFDIYFENSTEKVLYYDGPGDPEFHDTGLTYVAGDWQDITITADLSAATYSLDIEGNAVHGLPFAEAVTTLGAVNFGPNSAFQTIYVDNVEISYGLEPMLGDVNGDGAVNGLDVDPFVALVLSGAYQVEADCNFDTEVNGLDVDCFVALVIGGGAESVPEPSALVLVVTAVLALVGLGRWQRHGPG